MCYIHSQLLQLWYTFGLIEMKCVLKQIQILKWISKKPVNFPESLEFLFLFF